MRRSITQQRLISFIPETQSEPNGPYLGAEVIQALCLHFPNLLQLNQLYELTKQYPIVLSLPTDQTENFTHDLLIVLPEISSASEVASVYKAIALIAVKHIYYDYLAVHPLFTAELVAHIDQDFAWLVKHLMCRYDLPKFLAPHASQLNENEWAILLRFANGTSLRKLVPKLSKPLAHYLAFEYNLNHQYYDCWVALSGFWAQIVLNYHGMHKSYLLERNFASGFNEFMLFLPNFTQKFIRLLNAAEAYPSALYVDRIAMFISLSIKYIDEHPNLDFDKIPQDALVEEINAAYLKISAPQPVNLDKRKLGSDAEYKHGITKPVQVKFNGQYYEYQPVLDLAYLRRVGKYMSNCLGEIFATQICEGHFFGIVYPVAVGKRLNCTLILETDRYRVVEVKGFENRPATDTERLIVDLLLDQIRFNRSI